jgi:hypothetical protein
VQFELTAIAGVWHSYLRLHSKLSFFIHDFRYFLRRASVLGVQLLLMFRSALITRTILLFRRPDLFLLLLRTIFLYYALKLFVRIIIINKINYNMRDVLRQVCDLYNYD